MSDLTSLSSQLLEPFQYDFMRKAMLVGAVIGLVCAVLSCFLTLKGWALLGDALSHAIVPGVVVAYIFQAPFALGAFLAGLFSTLGIGFVKAHSRLREDAVIGIVFTSFFALGLVLRSLFPSNIDLKKIMLGNLLGISDGDAIQCFIIGGVSLLVIVWKWRDLMLYCFDADQARSLGLNTSALYWIFLGLLSVMTVAALQAVGACLVVAMLITPGATAYLLTDRFSRMLQWAALQGALTCVLGAYLSWFAQASAGGIIVTLQTVLFILAALFSPKYGIMGKSRHLKSQELLTS
jgi:manganese/iron transport system permease protein